MTKAETQRALIEIGARIRQRRTESHLTQERLAEQAEVSKSFISEVESGATAASGLVYLRIARALDVSVQWILSGAEDIALGESSSEPVIHPLLSEIAEREGWTHRETLEIAAALHGVVARRTRSGQKWEPSREVISAIAKALHAGHK